MFSAVIVVYNQLVFAFLKVSIVRAIMHQTIRWVGAVLFEAHPNTFLLRRVSTRVRTDDGTLRPVWPG